MTESSFTSDASTEAVQLPCSFLTVNLEPTRLLQTVNVLLSVVNILSCLTAVLGNFLILLAIWKRPSLRSTSVTLLASLALFDFCTGLVVQPSFVAYRLAQNRQDFSVYCTAGLVAETSGWMVGSVSFSIIILISVDRYLALRLHLRYQEIVTNRRMVAAVVTFCSFYAIVTSLRFTANNSHIFYIVFILLIGLGLVIITPIYAKIFQNTRYHQRRVFAEQRTFVRVHVKSSINMAKVRKSAISIAYIAISFQLCYLPLFCVLLVNATKGQSDNGEAAYACAIALVLLSSSINPVLYCWRMRDIRRAVMRLFQNYFPQFKSTVSDDDYSHITGRREMGTRNISGTRDYGGI